MNTFRCAPGPQSGISYIEVLIASVLIVITLVPMMDAVRGAISSASAHEDAAIQHLHLIAMLEDVLAEPFSSLETAATAAGGETVASSYSDLAGSNHRRLVYLSLYDGDNSDADDDPFTGVDPGLMWVRTEIEGTLMSFESLVSK
jgi:hypothetical protein